MRRLSMHENGHGWVAARPHAAGYLRFGCSRTCVHGPTRRYYTLDGLAKHFASGVPPRDKLIDALRAEGHAAARVHMQVRVRVSRTALPCPQQGRTRLLTSSDKPQRSMLGVCVAGWAHSEPPLRAWNA